MNASIFAALGEPNRLRIVETLRSRPLAVGDLAEALEIRQPQVSKHLRVLREAGIVAVEAVSRRRINHLRAGVFDDIADWVESFERVWDVRLDRLGAYLNQGEGKAR
jgi:DNA-binding transcriptional ArsR family regulator